MQRTFQNNEISKWWETQGVSLPLEDATAVWELLESGKTLEMIFSENVEKWRSTLDLLLDCERTLIDWKEFLGEKEKLLGQYKTLELLTPELEERIRLEPTPEGLEDLALPFRNKTRSKATLAREAGLTQLADWVWGCAQGEIKPEPGQTLEIWAFTFRNERAGFGELNQVLEGTSAILVERISENPNLRANARNYIRENAILVVEKKNQKKENMKFESLAGSKEPLVELLESDSEALRRYALYRKAWMEEELTLELKSPKPGENLLQPVMEEYLAYALPVKESPGAALLTAACESAIHSHIKNALEKETHLLLRERSERVQDRALLSRLIDYALQAPIIPMDAGSSILALHGVPKNPACLVAVGSDGKKIAETPFTFQTDPEKAKAKEILKPILLNPHLKALASGDSSSSREAERFLRTLFREFQRNLPSFLIFEGGAPADLPYEIARRALKPAKAFLESAPYIVPLLRSKNAKREVEFTFKTAQILSEKKFSVKALSFEGAPTAFSELKRGSVLPGIVSNVTGFGVFVDVGIAEQGLIHISKIPGGDFKDPRECIFVGDRVEVTILDLSTEKKQFALAWGERRLPRAPAPKRKIERRAAPLEKKIKPVKEQPKSAPFHNPFAALASLKNQLPKK